MKGVFAIALLLIFSCCIEAPEEWSFLKIKSILRGNSSLDLFLDRGMIL